MPKDVQQGQDNAGEVHLICSLFEEFPVGPLRVRSPLVKNQLLPGRGCHVTKQVDKKSAREGLDSCTAGVCLSLPCFDCSATT